MSTYHFFPNVNVPVLDVESVKPTLVSRRVSYLFRMYPLKEEKGTAHSSQRLTTAIETDNVNISAGSLSLPWPSPTEMQIRHNRTMQLVGYQT